MLVRKIYMIASIARCRVSCWNQSESLVYLVASRHWFCPKRYAPVDTKVRARRTLPVGCELSLPGGGLEAAIELPANSKPLGRLR